MKPTLFYNRKSNFKWGVIWPWYRNISLRYEHIEVCLTATHKEILKNKAWILLVPPSYLTSPVLCDFQCSHVHPCFFQKYDLILGLLDFSFHWCVRIWLYLATDFWEEDKRAPDGMKKISAVLLLHFPYHFMDRLIDAIEVKNEF